MSRIRLGFTHCLVSPCSQTVVAIEGLPACLLRRTAGSSLTLLVSLLGCLLGMVAIDHRPVTRGLYHRRSERTVGSPQVRVGRCAPGAAAPLVSIGDRTYWET
jgi:hypothetical protein